MDRRYLVSLRVDGEKVEDWEGHPYDLGLVRGLAERPLELHRRVTFLVGENGSGKSTLLEGIAVKWGFNAEGGSRNFNFGSRETHSSLHRALVLSRGVKRARTGYFLRAESFYNVATEIEGLSAGGPLDEAERQAAYGEEPLHEVSHGESFLALVMNRFSANGFYVLDEPEAALSPRRQLALLVRVDELAKAGAQFLIATHSPILMAYTEAVIYGLDADGGGLWEVAYEDTEHYWLTRRFLENREGMLRELLDGGQGELGLKD